MAGYQEFTFQIKQLADIDDNGGGKLHWLQARPITTRSPVHPGGGASFQRL